MKKNIDRKSLMYLYIFLNILIYFLSTILVIKSIDFKFISFFIISLCFYYVLNIFNMRILYYSIKDIASSIICNIILLLISLINMFDFNEAIIFFGVICLYQIIAKFLIISNINRRTSLMIIGENKHKKELKEEILKSRFYKLKYDENDIEKIYDIIDKFKVNAVIDFDTNILKNKKITDKILERKMQGLKFYDYTTFYEIFFKRLPINVLDESYFIKEDGFNSYQDEVKKNIKRIFDICFAIFILIFAIPIMIISSIIIKLESKGPIIYSQERIGQNNEEFKIYKFRSMRSDSEKDGPKWASENDNRITKFGNIMRKTRIDELPQLYNVLRGDMSFVGPRPERQFFINQLEKDIPFYNLRHTVKPGITGWAQTNYPYGASVEDSYRKLQYDLYYIKNYSILLDILIILDTVKIVVFGKGR